MRLALFGAVWLAAVPAALWRLATRSGPVAYDKMAHDGNAADVAPRPAVVTSTSSGVARSSVRPPVAVAPGGTASA